MTRSQLVSTTGLASSPSSVLVTATQRHRSTEEVLGRLGTVGLDLPDLLMLLASRGFLWL